MIIDHIYCYYYFYPKIFCCRSGVRVPAHEPHADVGAAAAQLGRPLLRAPQDVAHLHALPGRGQERDPGQASQHEGAEVRLLLNTAPCCS